MMKAVAALSFASALAAGPADLARARRRAPGSHVVGQGHVDMTQRLNAALRAMKGLSVKPCDDFTIEDLIELLRSLHVARDPSMEAIYRETGDLRMHIDPLDTLESIWAKEIQILKSYPKIWSASRDFKCHEAVMWMVHHVPQATQMELRKKVILPLLPERERQIVTEIPSEVDSIYGPRGLFPPGGLSCDSAHAQQPDSKAKNTEYVEWPEELTYTATGHGAFPFWDNSGPGCSYCDPSVSSGAQLKVRYSSKLNSEILMHESCGDMSWTGSSSAPKKSPCNHIFTPDGGAFIYTPKTSLEPDADGAFCCRTVKAGSTTFTGAVPRDWMKTSTYAGTYDNFEGDHYSGPIKMFTASGGLDFWYYTQPDGTPVQQGEGCQQPGGKKPTACAKLMPIVLYHDFDPTTWKNASFTSSDFVIPDVCKTTSYSCTIPGDTTTLVV